MNEEETKLFQALQKQGCSRYLGSKGHVQTLEEAEIKQMNILYVDRRCIFEGDNSLRYTTELAKPFVLKPLF